MDIAKLVYDFGNALLILAELGGTSVLLLGAIYGLL